MNIVLWYLNLICVEAGSMFILCLGEPVWIMDQISKNIIHFLRQFSCITHTENPWGSPPSEIIWKFHKTKISWLRRLYGLLSWSILVFGGWIFMVHPGSIPIFGKVLLILNFYYIDKVSFWISRVLGLAAKTPSIVKSLKKLLFVIFFIIRFIIDYISID